VHNFQPVLKERNRDLMRVMRLNQSINQSVNRKINIPTRFWRALIDTEAFTGVASVRYSYLPIAVIHLCGTPIGSVTREMCTALEYFYGTRSHYDLHSGGLNVMNAPGPSCKTRISAIIFATT